MKCNITNCEKERAEGKGLCKDCQKEIDNFVGKKMKKQTMHYGTWNKKGERKFLCSNSATYDEEKETDVMVEITCKNCRKILLLEK